MRTMRPRKPESVTGCKELIQTLSGNSGARIVGRSRFIKGIVAIFKKKFEYWTEDILAACKQGSQGELEQGRQGAGELEERGS